eukprot:TRINITY_DN65636_c0_g1_i1.p1 TRINITY_DN65636_c0_g1~~TRINITY_DN65636_c0_g1_i1.p1  ORF type:complete len:152 (+),score=25.53 TRINITY_DN65636_c0_g1_i1:47-457(+)
MLNEGSQDNDSCWSLVRDAGNTSRSVLSGDMAVMLCSGQCGETINIAGGAYLESIQKDGEAYCPRCSDEVERTQCKKPCANSYCNSEVRYSMFMLRVTGEDAPMFCSECSEYEDRGWSFCHSVAHSDDDVPSPKPQ